MPVSIRHWRALFEGWNAVVTRYLNQLIESPDSLLQASISYFFWTHEYQGDKRIRKTISSKIILWRCLSLTRASPCPLSADEHKGATRIHRREVSKIRTFETVLRRGPKTDKPENVPLWWFVPSILAPGGPS